MYLDRACCIYVDRDDAFVLLRLTRCVVFGNRIETPIVNIQSYVYTLRICKLNVFIPYDTHFVYYFASINF